MTTLDKNGQPYTPLTEADLARMRRRPFPSGHTDSARWLKSYTGRRPKQKEKDDDNG